MNDELDRRIDAGLQDHFRDAVADDGFSRGVMLALPRRSRRPRVGVWMGVVAGTLASFAALREVEWLQAGARAWLAGQTTTQSYALLATIAVLSVLAGLWVAMESQGEG